MNPLASSPHTIDRLLAALLDHPSKTDLSSEEWADHVAHCAYCQSTAQLIGTIGTEIMESPHVLAKGATMLEQPFPEDDQLSWYATLLQSRGRQEADRKLPAVARHVVTCASCQSLLEDIGVPYVVSALPERAHIWNQSMGMSYRLAGICTLVVNRFSVVATTTLASIRVESTVGSAVQLLDTPPAEHIVQDTSAENTPQGSTIIIPADPAHPEEQLHITLQLRATYTRWVSGLVQVHNPAGQPIADAPWSIRQANGTVIAKGTTDANGTTGLVIKHPGAYLLTIQSQERDWEIPLDIQYGSQP